MTGWAEQLPDTTDILFADGVFIKKNTFARAGVRAIQHSHAYEHVSVIASGRVRVRVNGNLVGEFAAGDIVRISAQSQHVFDILEDGTTILCIHNASRTGEIELAGPQEA